MQLNVQEWFRRHARRISSITVCVVLVLGVIAWWTWAVYANTSNVFWGMFENSLATPSVVLETDQTSGQNSLKQFVQFDLGTANRTHAVTILKQGGASVMTESIGTRDADYTRYVRIDAPAGSRRPDLSKVLNVWAKSGDTQQGSAQSSGHQLFAQAVLGVGLPVGSVPVPIGNLSSVQRDAMLRIMRGENVYAPALQSVKKQWSAGHLQYVYDVKIQTIPYVHLMQQFAKATGFHELDAVDPNTYQTTQPMNVKLTVDVLSRQLVHVDAGANGYNQTYEAYGLPVQAATPRVTVSTSELQNRLDNLK